MAPATAFAHTVGSAASSFAPSRRVAASRRADAHPGRVPRVARMALDVKSPGAVGDVGDQSSFSALKQSKGEKRLNIGILGAGRIGQVHAENIMFRLRNANLAGIMSGSKELADRCSLEHGCQPYYDYEEMCEDPNVDAVCICSASNKHLDQIIAAARGGKHIFCEKPIATDLPEIDRALAEVRKAGVKLQVGFNRRFDQNYRRVRHSIASGEIGNPHIVHIVSRDPSPPPIEYVKSSGGIWLDCAIHDMDMMRFLIGDEVDEVYALGAVNIMPEMKKYGDIDTSIITLKFKSGVMGTIDNSRQAVYGYDQRCEVLGSKGSVAINNNYQNSAIISTATEVRRDLPMNFFMDRYTDSFVTELNDFCEYVLNDGPNMCTGLDGRAPVLIALAAKKSYLEGRPVKISEVDIEMPPELIGWNGN